MPLFRIFRRVSLGAVYGIAGGFGGAAIGIFVGLTERDLKEEKREKRERLKSSLIARVRMISLLRNLSPSLENAEYEARRKLEELGYYPCSKCGVPHIDGGKADCLPPGTYFHKELSRYIEPDHPDWTEEGYEKATGQKWDSSVEEPDPNPIH